MSVAFWAYGTLQSLAVSALGMAFVGVAWWLWNWTDARTGAR